jgi:hypothetical protein
MFKTPERFPEPSTPIRVGFFLRMRVTLMKGKGSKQFDVVIFHQKFNP